LYGVPLVSAFLPWKRPNVAPCSAEPPPVLWILIVAQFVIAFGASETSFVVETKLLPDERDSNTVWLNVSHWPAGTIAACVKLIPTSANWPATSAPAPAPVPIGLFAAVMALPLTAPSAAFELRLCTFAPQHGGESFETKQVALLESVPSIHVSTWNCGP